MVQEKVVTMLTYDYTYVAGAFRIIDVRHLTRSELAGMAKDDEMNNHLFRYPLIAFGEHGRPLNNEIPQERPERKTFHEELKGVHFVPVTE